ncbi:sulfatase-like hydrolase/transferase [Hyphomonas sp.]|uniref:sulfatase-like hydrolase/transferase n=1 Tax=Hyphomonas sp. TaxID=87 RepID=UPI003528C33B
MPNNILFIMTDQEMNFPTFPKGFMDRLPGHSALLERGTHLVNYHVNTTPCSPSRSNIYTGQHTQLTGVYENSDTLKAPALPTDMPTLGHMLSAAGYYSSYKGKWHLSSINGVRDWNQEVRMIYPDTCDALKEYGFSDYGFDGESVGLTWAGHIDDVGVAADAAAQIREFAETDKTGGKPWFMAVNYVNPHDIMFYDATGKQAETRRFPKLLSLIKSEPGHPLYGEDLKIDLPESFFRDDLSTKPEAHKAILKQNEFTFGDLPLNDEAAWKQFRNYYFNCIRDVDQHIETLLWALERSGQMEDTIIVFTTDHGERAGAHGMRQKCGTIYREETNVPLVIVHPDVTGGQTTQALVSAVDIAPTLLGLAGRDEAWTEENFPDLVGIDTSGVVANPDLRTERDTRGHLFNLGVTYPWARFRDGSFDLSKRRLHRGVFDGKYKFARYFAPADHHLPRTFEDLVARNDLELYEVDDDPHELTNLACDAEAMKDELVRLNDMTNALIEKEIGRDEGQEYGSLGDIYSFTQG